MQRELRRYENRLVVIGGGVVGIAIWSLIKVILSLFMDDTMAELMETTAEGDDPVSQGLLVTVFLSLVVFLVGWHLFIGLSARSEGLGKRSRWAYLVSTVLIIIFYIYSMKAEIEEFGATEDDLVSGVISLLIDCSVVITLAELLHAAIRVKLYRRKLRIMEAA